MNQQDRVADQAADSQHVQVAVSGPRQRKMLSKHGTAINEPGYDDTKYIADDSYGFLAAVCFFVNCHLFSLSLSLSLCFILRVIDQKPHNELSHVGL